MKQNNEEKQEAQDTALNEAFQKEFDAIARKNTKDRTRIGAFLETINWANVGNHVYDVVTACISVADITTDVLVISNFYQKKQLTFFWIALSVVIIAQLSYAVAFYMSYIDDDPKCNKKWSILQRCAWFMVGVLFSPIMSFIFYFTSDETMYLGKIFKNKLRLYVPKAKNINNEFRHDWVKEEDKNKTERSKISEWIEVKMRKHLGFIMEAAIELSQMFICSKKVVYVK